MSYIDMIKERARLDKKTIVLPESNDKRTLLAAAKIMEEGIAIGMEKGIAIGETKGISIGKERAQSELLRSMHKNGFTAEQIAAAIDKDLEEVRAVLTDF